MDKELVRQYRERWQAVAAIEIEEQRAATIEQRWRQLNAIWNMAQALGILKSNADDEEVVYLRWSKLKEKFLQEQSQNDGPTLPSCSS